MLLGLILFSMILGFMLGIMISLGREHKELKDFNKKVKPIEFTGVVGKAFPGSQFDIENNVVHITSPQKAAVTLILKNEDNIFTCDRNKVTLNLKEGDKIKGLLYNYALEVRDKEINYYPVLRNVELIS